VIPSTGLARVSVVSSQVAEICDGIPLNKICYGDVTGLPVPQEGVAYIVSNIVAQAVKGKRYDCFVVDKTIRNEAGQVIGCEALAIL
jgi:hypothetical protein